MAAELRTRIADILDQYEAELLTDWVRGELEHSSRGMGGLREPELREQCAEFLRLLRQGIRDGEGGVGDLRGAAWTPLREMLAGISRSLGVQGYTPSETASFVMSFKRPLFARLLRESEGDAGALAEEIWGVTQVLDRLGLWTTEVHQKAREEVIVRQQQEMLELSTPVVKLWKGILALPMIGTLDSSRTQIVMETLLQKIVETGSAVAILDITGVPTVDTLTAQHLLKTVTAARLMGADCIISGIRPQIAQTIVHLGVDLEGVVTKATLADAFALALQRTGRAVVRASATPAGPADGSPA